MQSSRLPLQRRHVLASTWVGSLQLDRYKILYRVFDLPLLQWFSRRAIFLILLTFFFSAGFPDHVPPPRGDDLPHHVLIREQHGASGNTGHVSPRCSRRADRGKRWTGWAWWWSAEAFFHLTIVQCTMIIIHLWSNWNTASELVILSDVSQAAVFIIHVLCFSTKAAKMANYAKCQILCNLLFAMFTVLFMSSRLGVYPVWWVLRLFYLLHHN